MSAEREQVILIEINYAICYTNLHELFCQFISWTNWINSGKSMEKCWISCQAMADKKKKYNDLIIINLYNFFSFGSYPRPAEVTKPFRYLSMSPNCLGCLWVFVPAFEDARKITKNKVEALIMIETWMNPSLDKIQNYWLV